MINKRKITEFLSNKELFDYLKIVKDVGNHEFILKYKQQLGEFAVFLAEQNSLSIKAKSKLPFFHASSCIYTVRSLEQCTREEVADYKSSLIKGNHILTLAAGLGADDVAFSKKCKKLISIDNDEMLNAIARHNFKLLKAVNIERITTTAEGFISHNTQKFDAVYIDPDRRNDGKRQILLSEHQPDIIKLLPDLLKLSNAVWIKCSPLYDIDMAIKEIPTIEEIYCISLKGEVKEMLLKVGDSGKGNIDIICTDIGSINNISVKFNDNNLIPETAPEIKGYFYEAGAVLVKARKNHSYASGKQLKLIDKQVPFYIGETADEDFMGKCMVIKSCFPFNAKQIKLYLKANLLTQINIKVRGVPMDTKALFKKIEIKEGGDDFLFICPYRDKNVVIHCVPL